MASKEPLGILRTMATAERTKDRGQRNARRLLQQLGAELRDARLAAGVSQRHVAAVAGLSQSAVSRTELVQAEASTLSVLSLHAAALGLRLSLKVYPESTPVRDAAQLRLLDRLRRQVHGRYDWRPEAPLPGYGDLRAWDVALTGPVSIGIDAETRLHDIQALQRRSETKWRDSGLDRIVLLVSATRHNAAVLRAHREALRGTFPADTHAVMDALRSGRVLASNGLVVL